MSLNPNEHKSKNWNTTKRINGVFISMVIDSDIVELAHTECCYVRTSCIQDHHSQFGRIQLIAIIWNSIEHFELLVSKKSPNIHGTKRNLMKLKPFTINSYVISYLNLNFESEQEKTRTGKQMLQWNETVKMLTTLLNHIFGFFFWIKDATRWKISSYSSTCVTTPLSSNTIKTKTKNPTLWREVDDDRLKRRTCWKLMAKCGYKGLASNACHSATTVPSILCKMLGDTICTFHIAFDVNVTHTNTRRCEARRKVRRSLPQLIQLDHIQMNKNIYWDTINWISTVSSLLCNWWWWCWIDARSNSLKSKCFNTTPFTFNCVRFNSLHPFEISQPFRTAWKFI